MTGNDILDTLIAAAVAILAVLAVHAIARWALARAFHRHPVASIVIRHLDSPARWMLLFAALRIVWEGAPDDFPRLATLQHATTLALIAATTWLAACAVNALVQVVIEINPANVSDNIHARSVNTQARVLGRALKTFLVVFGIAAALITFPGVRQLGATLFASAGVAGLVVGLAARPALSNLLAGLQIALTQPIRIDDVVIVAGEWGRIEEITGAYVVVKIWDLRRLVVPLQWFIENPFQNWTRTSAQVIGSVFVWVDYALPVAQVREEFLRQCREAPEWDGQVAALQVTDASDRAIQLRGIASSADAGLNWDLRCKLREGLVDYVQRNHPEQLPRVRATARLDSDEMAAPSITHGTTGSP